MDIQARARTIRLKTHTLDACNSEEIARAFAKLTELKAGAPLVYGDPIFFLLRSQVLMLAAQGAVPTIYSARECVQDGGLIRRQLYCCICTAACRTGKPLQLVADDVPGTKRRC